MKFLSLLLMFGMLVPFSFEAEANGPRVTRVPPRNYESFRAALTRLNLGTNVEGLRTLAEVRPALDNIFERVARELVLERPQSSITAKKAEFETLLTNINDAALLASEVRINGRNYEGDAAKILDAIESLPLVVLEVANAGVTGTTNARGDIDKALRLSDRLARVTENQLNNLADATVIRAELERILGLDKDGQPITLDTLIRLCRGA